MNDPVIECPKCSHKIKLTESLAAPMLENARAEFAKQVEDVRTKSYRDAMDKARRDLSSELEGRSREANDLRDVWRLAGHRG